MSAHTKPTNTAKASAAKTCCSVCSTPSLCDYNWWAKLDEAGAYFVTRLKTNAAVETIQRFLGRSANAVKLQILCAMIAYLLLKLYQQNGRTEQSLHLLCVRIAGSLFERPQTLYAHYARQRRERLELARMQGVLF